MDISRSTLGELASLAIERELIKHFTFSKSSIDISIGDLNINLSPEDARKLLQLIIAGATREAPTPGKEQAGSDESHAASPDIQVREAVLQEVTQDTAAVFQEDKPPVHVQEAPQADAYQKRELFRAPQVSASPDQPYNATLLKEEVRSADGHGGTDEGDDVSEEYLDSVLSFALTMGIIEGYTKDRDSRTVTLRTGATTTGLSYWETLEYLTNSMLYELRPRTER